MPCAVLVALVRSGGGNLRKALLVSSLHECRATLDPHRTQWNNVDLQHQDRDGPRNLDHVDPPNQNDRPGHTGRGQPGT